MENNNDKVRLWGDVVSIKDLLISILISVVSTMAFYSFAPKGNNPKQLVFGLSGAVLGFVITSIIFKPKRDIKEEK